jgi:hypothetical protein
MSPAAKYPFEETVLNSINNMWYSNVLIELFQTANTSEPHIRKNGKPRKGSHLSEEFKEHNLFGTRKLQLFQSLLDLKFVGLRGGGGKQTIC